MSCCRRGWVPLLRLLEAVPSWEDGATISASYQCVESVCRCAAGQCCRPHPVYARWATAADTDMDGTGVHRCCSWSGMFSDHGFDPASTSSCVLFPWFFALHVRSDFLPTMPKIYVPKALEVVQLFAAQKSAINISLSAVGLLWNATDLLGRSRAAAGAAAAAAATAAAAAAAAEAPEQQPLQHSGSSVSSALGGIFSVLSLSRRPTVEDPAIKAAAVAGGSPAKQGAAAAAGSPNSSATTARAGSPLGGKSSGAPDADARTDSPATAAAGAADPHLAGRSDLTEDECTELLIRVFEHLRAIGMDPRPEVGSLPTVNGLMVLLCVSVCRVCIWPWTACLKLDMPCLTSWQPHRHRELLGTVSPASVPTCAAAGLPALCCAHCLCCRSATAACARCFLLSAARQVASARPPGATACGRSSSRSSSMLTSWET